MSLVCAVAPVQAKVNRPGDHPSEMQASKTNRNIPKEKLSGSEGPQTPGHVGADICGQKACLVEDGVSLLTPPVDAQYLNEISCVVQVLQAGFNLTH